MKERLDVLLKEKHLFESRENARIAIMEGLVYVDGAISDKPGTKIDVESEIEIRGDLCPYVGRGGLKLEKAIREFHLSLNGKTCMDVGASTGGFTDCMLAKGASHVYSIDVGYGQLAWKLRNDPRVTNIEKCNFRYFDKEELYEKIDFISIDVSFISLAIILPVAYRYLCKSGEIVCLVKPQFEAGKNEVGKNGVVRDSKVHESVLRKVISLAERINLYPKDITFSPITGAKGNIEYLLYLSKTGKMIYNIEDDFISKIVSDSHRELKK